MVQQNYRSGSRVNQLPANRALTLHKWPPGELIKQCFRRLQYMRTCALLPLQVGRYTSLRATHAEQSIEGNIEQVKMKIDSSIPSEVLTKMLMGIFNKRCTENAHEGWICCGNPSRSLNAHEYKHDKNKGEKKNFLPWTGTSCFSNRALFEAPKCL